MHSRRLSILAVVLLVTALPGAALFWLDDDRPDARMAFAPTASAASGQNDANSGRDAGNAADKALELPGKGRYHAALPAFDQADHFRLKVNEPTARCVQATVTGSEAADVVLRLTRAGRADRVHEATHDLAAKAVLALATPDVKDVFLGVAGDGSTSVGDYDFDLDVHTPAELSTAGDAGSGGDAGDTLATATVIERGCLGGTLGGNAADTADVYALKGTYGDAVRVSFVGHNGLSLTVSDPTGQAVAKMHPGGDATITFDQDGTWYLSVQGGSSSEQATAGAGPGMGGLTTETDTYGIGVGDGPCRPTCGG